MMAACERETYQHRGRRPTGQKETNDIGASACAAKRNLRPIDPVGRDAEAKPIPFVLRAAVQQPAHDVPVVLDARRPGILGSDPRARDDKHAGRVESGSCQERRDCAAASARGLQRCSFGRWTNLEAEGRQSRRRQCSRRRVACEQRRAAASARGLQQCSFGRCTHLEPSAGSFSGQKTPTSHRPRPGPTVHSPSVASAGSAIQLIEPSQRPTPSAGSRPIGPPPPRRVRSSGDQSAALLKGAGIGCDSTRATSSLQSSGLIEG